jgi:oxygen-independent coproporphyrinogen-3 oxidase
VYWDGRPYLGLGNGAHSYAHPIRRWNVRDWGAYRSRLLAGAPPEESREQIDEGARALERTWLGLRTSQGLPLAELGAAARSRAEAWARDGRAVLVDGRLRLTAEGWLQLDGLAVELDVATGGAPGVSDGAHAEAPAVSRVARPTG